MKLILRKAQEITSGLYRCLVYPFIRVITEIKTKSIMKQGSYINKGTVLGGRNYLGRRVYLTHTELGFGSYVADDSRLIEMKIGKYCSIGSQVFCAYGKHPTKDFVSTHPAFYSASAAEGFTYSDSTLFAEAKYIDENAKIRVKVGNDVWIGARVTILEGIEIGDGAVIAAGAVVNKDVEPYSIYGGVPAKKIGNRFDNPDDIEFIKSTKWWELDEKELKKRAYSFASVEEFKDSFSKESMKEIGDEN